MNYCIISKVHIVDGVVVYTPVGYTINHSDCDIINNNYDSTLGVWVDNNKVELENGTKNISEFFDTTPYVHDARHQTTSIDGMGLHEITNITPYL